MDEELGETHGGGEEDEQNGEHEDAAGGGEGLGVEGHFCSGEVGVERHCRKRWDREASRTECNWWNDRGMIGLGAELPAREK